jgi:hypothetical protein
LSHSLADKNYLLSAEVFWNHRIFLNRRFFDNFTARLIFDFRSTTKSLAFIHLIWNYVEIFYTARIKSCKSFIEFQSVTMEIYKPEVTRKLQKQQNLGKFLIFDVCVQLWIFTLSTNIRNVNFILSHATLHIIGKYFCASQEHRCPHILKLSLINFVIFRKILQKKHSISITIFSKKEIDIWLFQYIF